MGGGGGYTDADVDARLLDRLQNVTQSGVSFFDHVLIWDDNNPSELRFANMGGLRLYVTASWAQPTNIDEFPPGKLAGGGSTGQVLTRTGAGQAWEDATGMGGGLLTVASDGTLSGDGTSGDPLGVADNSITTLQLANDAVRTANIGVGAVHADELADDAVTEPKLAASNAPGSNQVLSWDGTALTWADQTGMGGGTVTTTDPITGDGSAGTPLALDLSTLLQPASLALSDRLLVSDASGGHINRIIPLSAFAIYLGEKVSAAVTSPITGDGLAATPLTIAADSITEPLLSISNSPAANQVLSWTGSELAWTAAGAGTGDITAVTTATGSGLSGGVDSGAANLVLDIAGLTNQSSSTLSDSDMLLLGDVSDGSDPRKHLTIGGLFGFAASGESTTESGGGKIRVADAGITATQLANDAVTEPKLAASNAPGTSQVLSWDGSAMTWADQTGMGGGLLTVASDATLSGDGTSGDPLGVADDSITTLQLADSAVRTVNLGLLAVHGVQIADDTITEPKLAASNDPATGQVMSWDGAALTWDDPNGTGRSFIVPRSGVSGTGTDVALTTGRSLTSYELGDRFQFRMENTPTGSMSIAVDGLPAIQLTKGGTVGDLRAGVGDVRLNDGIIATYLDPEGNGQTRFWMSYLAVGNAAREERRLLCVRDT